MCGIAGILDLDGAFYGRLRPHLELMNRLQAHRGPDGEGVWLHARGAVGLGHRRLSIIDLEGGAQPMADPGGNVISYNGEVYNWLELRQQLGEERFRTRSDTEVILEAYRRWGTGCLRQLRGMFAFALWDEQQQLLFCARDRFGVKPLYWTVVGRTLFLASEAKALLPFLPDIETDGEALRDYLHFQLCLDGKTLFKGVRELLPGERLIAKGGQVSVERYWEIYYDLDFDHTKRWFEARLRERIEDSVRMHLRADVPVGAYLSGGLDSGIVSSVAARLRPGEELSAFNGRFALGPLYDESDYARRIAERRGMQLHVLDMGPQDFVDTIERVIWHLDYPVAGPGAFPQFHVSRLAARHRKVVLGGQGGDEIFGGYVRYLVAYFEQCIKGAIEGTADRGQFLVTYESIIPNLRALESYKPLLQDFWREGLFEDLDRRYYRLVNRARNLGREIRWGELGSYSPYETFHKIFHGANVEAHSYFDRMTHFDFKTLLPGLLQVEDRMSMAHGLESRVPFLDHPLVELAATIPPNVKFEGGTLKKVLLGAMGPELPAEVVQRKDKMGFPVPLDQWLTGELRGFVTDLFQAPEARRRPYFDADEIVRGLDSEPRFGRKVWGLLSLELWHRCFHDKAAELRRLAESATADGPAPGR